MKKIFTLALTLFILNAAFSQMTISRFSIQSPNFDLSYNRNYGNGYYNNGYNNGGYYNNSYGDEKSWAAEKINYDYNQSVQQVMCLQISAERKTKLINQLEREKARKLRRLNRHSCYDENNYNYQPANNYGWRR